MPLSILTFKKIIENQMKSMKYVNQSLIKLPTGPPNPWPSCGCIEVLANTGCSGIEKSLNKFS